MGGWVGGEMMQLDRSPGSESLEGVMANRPCLTPQNCSCITTTHAAAAAAPRRCWLGGGPRTEEEEREW